MLATLHPRRRTGSAMVMTVACVLAGCSDRPSFEMRWQLPPEAGAEAVDLTSPVQCSAVGIGQIRVSSLQDGVTVDTRTFPCYPSEFADDGLVPGPELEDGTYRIEFEPLSHAGGTFTDVAPTTRELTVSGTAVALTDIEIVVPPQCADGIDNDVDGLVDAHDPSCLLPESREDLDTSLTTFVVSQQLLGGYTRCSAVDIAEFQLEFLDGDTPIRTPASVDCVRVGTIPVSVQLPPAANCTSDCYTWRLTAVDYQGNALTQPRIGTFAVTPEKNDLIPLDATLVGDDFVEPISSPLAFSVSFKSNDASFARSCQPNNQDYAGILEVTGIELTFFDENLNEIPLNDGDGEPFADTCPAAPLASEEVSPWGSYFVGVKGLAGDEVCFSNLDNPAPLGAHTTESIVVPRAMGIIPDACVDCHEDADCGACTECCVGGICRKPTPCAKDADCGDCENCCINNSCKTLCVQDADCGACENCCENGFCK